MDFSSIIARLKSQTSGFRQIGGLADLEATDKTLVAPPAVFVAPVSETPSDNLVIDGTNQIVEVRFSVILALSNQRDASGAQSLDDLNDRRSQIRAVIYGWEINPTTCDPILFCGGKLLKFSDGLLWWGDEFSYKTFY